MSADAQKVIAVSADTKGRYRDRVAEEMKASSATAARLMRVDKAFPELFQEILEGKLRIRSAERIVRMFDLGHSDLAVGLWERTLRPMEAERELRWRRFHEDAAKEEIKPLAEILAELSDGGAS